MNPFLFFALTFNWGTSVLKVTVLYIRNFYINIKLGNFIIKFYLFSNALISMYKYISLQLLVMQNLTKELVFLCFISTGIVIFLPQVK